MKVTFKWGKEILKDVEINLSESVETLRMQLFSLTGVPPDRQKIMGVKGGFLKDGTDLQTLGLKEGQSLMLMGTAGEVLTGPVEKVVFVEDLGEDAVASYMVGQRAGLTNLGNTCYMNATLQCLFSVKDFVRAVKKQPRVAAGGDIQRNIATSIVDVFDQLEGRATVTPMRFLTTLRAGYPQFAERGEGGGYAQQDAEECLTQTLTCLNLLREEGEGLADKYFGIKTQATLTCVEADGEVTMQEAKQTKLPCHIDSTVSLLIEGMKHSLGEETLTKFSTTLNRDSIFSKRTRISHLPPFLFVQEVRFDWRTDTQKKAKILRNVTFPIELDTIDLLSESLAQQTLPNRTALDAIRQRELDAKKARKNIGAAAVEESASVEMSDAPGASTEGAAGATGAYNGTGRYVLQAVLTHQGRYADGGHYMAWVKNEGDGDDWTKFDDDRVSTVNTDEIRKLTGGGDWHMAYILLYRHLTV